MEEIIIIQDRKLAMIISKELHRLNKRNPKLKYGIYFNQFTVEELSSISELTIPGNSNIKDISELEYLTNLKKLTILSLNPKDLAPNQLDAKFYDFYKK